MRFALRVLCGLLLNGFDEVLKKKFYFILNLMQPYFTFFSKPGSLGCWSHLDPVTQRLRGVGVGTFTATGQFSLKDIVYQDAGIYKCVGQSSSNKKKLEVLNSVIVGVKGKQSNWIINRRKFFVMTFLILIGFPTVTARNKTPSAFPGLPLHLNVEFCANPPATAGMKQLFTVGFLQLFNLKLFSMF